VSNVQIRLNRLAKESASGLLRLTALAGLVTALLAGGPARAGTTDYASLRDLADGFEHCGEVGDSSERLACYDGLKRRPRAATEIVTLADPPSRDVGDAAQRTRDRRPVRPPRIEAGYNGASGSYAGSSKTSGGILEANSMAGGLGGGLAAKIWLDDWPRQSLSFGVEYLEIANRGTLTAHLPKGISILTDPVYAHMGAAVRADVGFVNIAYYPVNTGRVRTAVGAGLGLGYGSAVTDDVVENDFIGISSGLSKSGAPIAGLQSFVDVDYYVTDRLYLSLGPKVFWVTAHPIGINQRYLDFIVGADIGYRFR